MRKRKSISPNDTLTPVGYDRRTGLMNDPLDPVYLNAKTGEVTDPYKPAGYDSHSGMYYDGFAKGGGEYVTPQDFSQMYGLRALAEGGYVQAGEPVVVGDGGQSEYFVPDNSPQYQGNYQRMMDYINSGKQMDMAPQPAIPYSDEHFQSNYNTPIPADKAQDYDLWKFQQSRRTGRDVTEDQRDYDVQGFYMKGGATSGNQHGPDTFKKPNHPTFSNQSQYSGMDGYEGGRWGKNADNWSFTPSETNKSMWSPKSRQRYFQQVEPGNALMENVGGKMMNVNVPTYGLRALAQGGYVNQGEPVIVGDGGQPELFVPDQSGYVYPQVPQQVYRNAYGDGLTQEELDRVTAMQGGGPKPRMSGSQGGFMSEGEYYGQKAAEAAEGQRQQARANWLSQPISRADVNAPEYGHKYYSTLGNQGPEAVAGLPVPKNYAPPIGITNTPNDPSMRALEDIRQGKAGNRGAFVDFPLGKIAEVTQMVKENSQQTPMQPQQDQPPRVGLSAMSPDQQDKQGQQMAPPSQVQAAQAILGTINNGGTPRDTINMMQQVTGTRGNMVPGENGAINLVGDDGRVLHSFRGPQDVIAYAYKHLGDNSGLPDHYLSLDQKEARRKDQMKTNEKLVDYMATIENRNYQRQADREKMDMNSAAKVDEYNRSLAVLYAKELDAAKKAHKDDLYNGDKPFDKEAFDQSFEAGLARFGVSPRTGGRSGPMAQSQQQQAQSGTDWTGLPTSGGSSPRVGLGQPQGVTPEYRDLYELEQGMRGGSPAPQQAPQRQAQTAPQQQSPQTSDITPQSLKAAVASGQISRGQAEQYAQQQGWIRPQAAPAQSVPQQAPVSQQQMSQGSAPVGLSAMQEDTSPPVPYLDNPGAYVPNMEGASTYSPNQQGNSVRRVVTKPDTSRLAAYLAALKAQGGDAAVEQYLRSVGQGGSGRRPYGNDR